MRILLELEFQDVSFYGRRKTGELVEKPSEQGLEPTTNSIHLWQRAGIEPGLVHIGRRRTLSPRRHPCSQVAFCYCLSITA